MSNGYSVSNLVLPLAPAAIKFELSGSPLAPAFGSSAFLQDNRMDKVVSFASEDLSADTLDIDIDMGGAVSLGGFAILNHNFASVGCNCTVICSAASDYSSPTTAKAATPLTSTRFKSKDHALQFTPVSKRYWKLRFSNGDALVPYIGEWAFGAAVTLPRFSIYGSGESRDVFGPEVDFANGNKTAYFLGGPVRTKNYQFADLSASDLAAYDALWDATKGFTLPFLWLEDIESTATAATVPAQECIFGRFELPSNAYAQDDYGIFQPGAPFNIRSLGRDVGS
jgi:hypothetical protein